MIKYLLIVCISLFLLLESAFGLTKYGDAQIVKGTLTIFNTTNRQEKTYTKEDGEILVKLNDLLRVNANSLIVLKTVEDTDIKMGSHALFLVAPWEKREKKGNLRMLYGKMSFKTKKLKGKRRFRLKTASATISVKGTGGNCEAGSTGNTGCIGKEGVFTLQGNKGPEQNLEANKLALVVGNNPVTKTMNFELADDMLNKPPAISKESTSLEQENVAVAAGLISQEDLDESKSSEASAESSFGDEEQAAVSEEEAESAADVDVSDAIESAVQENTRLKGKMRLLF